LLSGTILLSIFASKILKSLEIPLPPLAEQEQIVGLLDEADGLRRLRRQANERMREFVPALFHEMFGDPAVNERGWKVKRLCDLLLKIDSGWSPVCLDRPAEKNEWGMLKLGAVTYCEYDDSKNKANPPKL
jgi:type I restriction enzyme S subunit